MLAPTSPDLTLSRAAAMCPASMRPLVNLSPCLPSREEAFEREMLPHAPALLRTALRMTAGDPAAAEDAVQETLLRAWKAFAQFEAGTNARAWLFRILLNFLSKQRQRAAARPGLVSLDEHEESRGQPVAAPPEPARFADSDVFAALHALPEEHRAVLLLAVVEGFTCKEVAATLELPIGTVMSRLSRARVGLRNALLAVGATGHGEGKIL